MLNQNHGLLSILQVHFFYFEYVEILLNSQIPDVSKNKNVLIHLKGGDKSLKNFFEKIA